mmetsp:Transcript_1483/g.6044  ORF Transcript_1483/g.6044 Transcript_1483/m.6044 type:complete len:293 (-) Transcript_1483:514-1392(-)
MSCQSSSRPPRPAYTPTSTSNSSFPTLSTRHQPRIGSSTSGDLPPTRYSYADENGPFARTAHVGTTMRPSGGGRFRLRSFLSASSSAADLTVGVTTSPSSPPPFSPTSSPPFFTRPRPARPLPEPTRTRIRSSSDVDVSSDDWSSIPSDVLPSRGGSSSKLRSNDSSSNRDSHVRNVAPWTARHSPAAMSSSPSRGARSGDSGFEPRTSPFASARASETSSTSASRQSRFSPGRASTVTSTRILRAGRGGDAGRSGASSPPPLSSFLSSASLMGPFELGGSSSGRVRCENPN